MKKKLLCLIVLLANLTVFSQTTESDFSEDVTFTDGTTFASDSVINKDNFQLSQNDINIYKKNFQGKLRDIGKSPLQVSKNALAAISKRNNLISKQIRKNINGYYSFEQNGKDTVVFGLSSIKNHRQLDRCVQNQNCQLECEATIIQLKVKDRTENIILISAVKILKD